MQKKRAKIKAYLTTLLNTLDPGGSNVKRITEMIDNMSDAQFTEYMTALRDKREQMFIYSPNLKNKITMRSIMAAAAITKTDCFEQVWLIDNATGKRYLTSHKYMILNLPVRRVKQFLMDKMSVPESDKKTDLLTGQVVKPDKGSSVSLIEMQLIADKGLDLSIYELLKARGGDVHAYAEYSGQMLETGRVDLRSLSSDSTPRSAVIAGVYLKAMHIDNNLVE